MTELIPMSNDDGQQREQTERQQWEALDKELKELIQKGMEQTERFEMLFNRFNRLRQQI